MPTDLDLLVGAAEVIQLSVTAPTHPIPGAVHPCPGRTERARHKPRRGQPRPAPVAQPHAAPGNVQLPGHTGRHRTQPSVQHEQRGPGHRRSDRRDAATRRQRRAHRRIDGGLGRAVGVDHQPTGCPPVHHLGRTGLAGHYQRRGLQRFGRQHPHRGRGLADHADAFAGQQGVKVVGRERHQLGYHQQASTAQQCSPDLPHREVEGIGMALRPHAARRELSLQ
ncbi:hypothetical protein LAUMK191_05211 [Mycobacterium attenuatum]|nr:hypothetical protein LAUMK191_05211 [Mycobacterium attenuatum]